MVTHHGGCHCGAVKISVRAPERIKAYECNCSLCSMLSFLHLIVPASHFKLIKGKSSLSLYQFNSKTARHYFCKHCGVKSFYVPRSHPDGISVNVRCLNPKTIKDVKIKKFDGKNWEKNIGTLKTQTRKTFK